MRIGVLDHLSIRAERVERRSVGAGPAKGAKETKLGRGILQKLTKRELAIEGDGVFS